MRTRGMLLAVAPLFAALVPAPVSAEDPPVRRLPVRPVPQPPAGGTTVLAQVPDDAAALKEVGLTPTEAGPLLDYLKSRTLTDADLTRVADVIARFGADDFDDRSKATEEVEKFGPAAIGPLKAAAQSADPEVAYRARAALRRVEKVPHAAVAGAAVRAVVKLKPAGAAAALLGFLPMADTDEVADDIRAALVELAVAGGKPEPALVQALDDKSAVRRSAAYVALVEGGSPADRPRLKDALPLVRAAVRKEPDPDAKFRGLWSLVLAAREKEAVPDLIDLIPQLNRGRVWQLEEFLLQAAGADRPEGGKFGKSPEALGKARDAWAGWWKAKGPAFDLTAFAFNPRITGYTDLIEQDATYGRFRVTVLGPDLKEKGRFGGGNVGVNMLNQPTDIKRLPGGTFLVAEMSSSRVTERDAAGRILKTTAVGQPLNVDRTADGGMVVVCRNQVILYDKDGKQVWAHNRNQYDVMGGKLLPNGEVLFVTNWNGQPNTSASAIRLDKNGKEAGKPVPVGRLQQFQSIDVTADDKLIACEYNRVVEYDLKTGKELWQYAVNGAQSVQRLPNGNTLIAHLMTPQGQQGKVLEVEPGGEVVWEYAPTDNMRPFRAVRR